MHYISHLTPGLDCRVIIHEEHNEKEQCEKELNTRTHTHTRAHTHSRTDYANTCIQISRHMIIMTHMHACVPKSTHTHTHTYTHTYTYACTHTYTHTCVPRSTHTHTKAHTCKACAHSRSHIEKSRASTHKFLGSV